jgi:hypothetical protein
LNHGFGRLTAQVYMQKAMVQIGPAHFDPVGQYKAALKRAACDATVQVNPVADIFGLATAHHKLAILDRDLQVMR